MNFAELKKYQQELDYKIQEIATLLKIQMVELKELCRDISYQTPYSMSDVMYMVSEDLKNNLSFNDIKKKYNIT